MTRARIIKVPADPGISQTAAGVGAPGSGGRDEAGRGDWAHCDADAAVTTLYRAHYRSLVRLAALLTDDVAAAEKVVQDSFVALHAAWQGHRGRDQGPAYLRRAVVSGCRALLRRRPIAARDASRLRDGKSGADHPATAWLECSAAVTAALRTLPARQREALVLRYYSDLSEAQAAAVMGISNGAVRTHTARAMASLRAVLEEHDA